MVSWNSTPVELPPIPVYREPGRAVVPLVGRSQDTRDLCLYHEAPLSIRDFRWYCPICRFGPEFSSEISDA